MSVPEDREYTSSHEWIQLDGESALIGLTASHPNLAEVVRVRLPFVGKAIRAGDEAAALVFRGQEQPIRAPLSGSVTESNAALEPDPGLLASHPYGSGWLFRLEIEAGEEIEHLMDSAAYRDFLQRAESIEVP